MAQRAARVPKFWASERHYINFADAKTVWSDEHRLREREGCECPQDASVGPCEERADKFTIGVNLVAHAYQNGDTRMCIKYVPPGRARSQVLDQQTQCAVANMLKSN